MDAARVLENDDIDPNQFAQIENASGRMICDARKRKTVSYADTTDAAWPESLDHAADVSNALLA